MKQYRLLAMLVLAPLFMAACAKTGHESLFPNDKSYSYEALRTLGYTAIGAADINEVLQTISRIEGGNRESWIAAWMDLADRTACQAKNLNNDTRGRGLALLRSSNYYRTAEFFIPGEDARKYATYNRCRDTFYAGLEEMVVPYEILHTPFQGSYLETLFFPSTVQGPKANTLIIFVNGYDSIKEEAYFALGKEALERGYAFLSYDGPGQGAAIRRNQLPLTADWAPVNSAIIDTISTEHPEFEHFVLVGFSLGSILATKAAATDHRIDALVHYDIFHDFADAVGDGMPRSFRNRIFTDGPVPKGTNRLLKWFLTLSSETDWALRHGAWIFSRKDDYIGVLRAYMDFEIESSAPAVNCPVLLIAGEEDHFVPIRLAEDSKAAFTGTDDVTVIRYSAESGGGEHCQVGALNLWTGDFFNWLNNPERKP